MKNTFLVLAITLNSLIGLSQGSYEKYEEAVYEDCGDCNNAKLNSFLLDRINVSDSILEKKEIQITKLIEDKIVATSTDSVKKKELTSILSQFCLAIYQWKQTRKLSADAQKGIYSGGTMQSQAYGVMYLYVSDQIISFIEGYENHIKQFIR